MHAGHGERFRFVDCQDARSRMRTRHQGYMAHSGGTISRRSDPTHDETAILTHAAIGRDETKLFFGCAHLAAFINSFMVGPAAG
jgi:hypothetical protein